MVSALIRKEPIPTAKKIMTSPVHPWRGQSTKDDENFPYALREFINSRVNLPTFEDIFGKSKRLDLKMVR